LFSSKLKIAILLVLPLVALLIIFNLFSLNTKSVISPSSKSVKNKVNSKEPNNSATTLALQAQTQSTIVVKEVTNFSLENSNRLDEILNDCSQINMEEQYPAIENKIEEIAEYFQANGTLENQVNNIMITGRVTDANRLALFDYAAKKPTDKIVYKLALAECFKNSHLPQCNDQLFVLANLADKNNASLLLDIASIFLRQGKDKEAQLTIEKAAKSNYYNSYYNEYTQRFQNIILDNTALGFNQSLVMSIGLSAALPFSLSSFIEFCKNNNENNYVLSDACGKVGILMENHSYTEISKAFGLALQEIHFKQTNSQKSLEAVQKRSDAFNKRHGNSLELKGSELFLFDEKLARFWLNTAVNIGEKLAFEAVAKEVYLLLKNPDYNPCRNPLE